jgi:hypothetical protein
LVLKGLEQTGHERLSKKSEVDICESGKWERQVVGGQVGLRGVSASELQKGQITCQK